MCGITGVAWTADAEPASPDVVWRMTDVLSHRGPDDARSIIPPPAGAGARRAAAGWSGRAGKAGAALGFRRLAIIDLVTGQQPLANEDETVWIAFNGEIYNYRELRPDLEARGHRFRTHSDTETIVHLYEEYGPDCVEHLRGMFALAIWDDRRQRLFLARDRLGKKPLYYRLDGARLLFGSELKALLQFPGAPREVDPAALDMYLTYQYVPHPQCIFGAITSCRPGTGRCTKTGGWRCAVIGRRRTRRRRRTPTETARVHNTARTSDGKNELRSTLTEAVRLRMRSDVPLGAFLSGGIDSTIISGLMQQLSTADSHVLDRLSRQAVRRDVLRPRGGRLPGHAASRAGRRAARPVDSAQADLALRRAVLRQLGHSHDVSVGNDAPRSDGRAFRRRRRRNVLRVRPLPGRRHRPPARPLPRWVKGFLSPRLAAVPELDRAEIVSPPHQAAAGGVGKTPERRYLRWINIFDDGRRQELYTDEFAARVGTVDSSEFLLDAYAECPDRDFVSRTMCADMLTYLPCDILTKVDIASMAYSLECRCPFLDHKVAELAARMPIELKQTATRRQADPDRHVPRFAAAVDSNAVQDGLRRAAGRLVPRRTAAPAVRNAARLVEPVPRLVQTGKHSPADRGARPATLGPQLSAVVADVSRTVAANLAESASPPTAPIAHIVNVHAATV